jgi:hypothetical protein
MAPDLRRVLARHLTLTACAVLCVTVVGGVGPGGVVLGGGVIALSLWLYAALFQLTVRGGRRRLAITLLFAKLAAFLGLGWLAFASGSGRPDPLGFALGVTCLPAAVVWDAVRGGKG